MTKNILLSKNGLKNFLWTEKMPIKKKSIDLRLTLNQEDPIYNAFLNIKKASGIKNNSDVLRFIFKQLSKISFSELMNKFDGDSNSKEQKVEA